MKNYILKHHHLIAFEIDFSCTKIRIVRFLRSFKGVPIKLHVSRKVLKDFENQYS